MIARVGCLGWVLALVGASGAILPAMVLDDPATEYLVRHALVQGCYLGDRRPWSADDVAACLDSTPAISWQQRWKARYGRALSDSGGPLIEWRQGEDLFAFDVGIRSQISLSGHSFAYPEDGHRSADHEFLASLRVRPRVNLQLGQDLSMWMRGRQLVEFSDVARFEKRLDARQGVYQTALMAKSGEAATARTNDWIEGAVELQSNLGRFRAGLLPVRWGTLPLQTLMLSGNTESMAMVEGTKSVGPISGSVLFARLIGDTFRERRNLYAHRAQWQGNIWRAAWSEAVVTVERNVEPLYLVPIFPFFLVEHHLGDPDNRQMDFDVAVRPAKGVELSSELFLDDLQNYLGFFSNGWGNKWGLGLGASVADLAFNGSLDQIQATRIEPWVGTSSSAVLPGAPRNLPVHFGVPLGHPSGPNSLTLEWLHRQELTTGAWWVRTGVLWKGTSLGSDEDDLNWRDSAGTWAVATSTKKWLSGALQDRESMEFGMEKPFGKAWTGLASLGWVREDGPTARDSWPWISLGVTYRD